jgi:hypothetical protein
MNPDQYKKKHKAPRGDDRTRRQIAVEAARRMLPALAPGAGDAPGRLRDAGEGEFYAAKRKAAAVLGHAVRPGDLPTDSEVREQALILIRSSTFDPGADPGDGQPEPAEGELVRRLADHVDRFALYRMRLEPLEAVKQNARYHPEGDALFHSLQVFERARDARPYDEEFLLAALLHDVGKAIDPGDHVAAGLQALEGTITGRTATLIGLHMDALAYRQGTLGARARGRLERSEEFEDCMLLRELDTRGRVPGAVVCEVAEALNYIKELANEFDDGPE